MTNQTKPTFSHVAEPCDSRCRWWQKVFSSDDIKNIDPSGIDGANCLPGSYLRKGQDLELSPGDVIIDGEAAHHRKQRGWTYVVGIVNAEASEIVWKQVKITEQKAEMKEAGWQIKGSGPVAAAVRLAQWLMA